MYATISAFWLRHWGVGQSVSVVFPGNTYFVFMRYGIYIRGLTRPFKHKKHTYFVVLNKMETFFSQ